MTAVRVCHLRTHSFYDDDAFRYCGTSTTNPPRTDLKIPESLEGIVPFPKPLPKDVD